MNFRPYAILAFICLLGLNSCKDTKESTEPVADEVVEQETADMKFWMISGFERPAGSVNPVLAPDSTSSFYSEMNKTNIAWESNDVFNPAATVMGDSIYVLYRAEDKSGVGIGMRTSRIGLAATHDGFTMNRAKAPVMYPKVDDQQKYEWKGGCEDPRVAVTEDGTYVMLYTQWNNDTPRIGVATSTNLRDWDKHGPAFEEAYDGKYLNIASKSASILTQLKDGKITIAKTNGEYFMYWGEHHVYAATSPDLINWKPLEDQNGELLQLMSPREGFFDSHLTECGPPALLTDEGVVLIYNGKNLPGENGAPDFTPNTYCAGQALFDKNDPTKFKDRLDKPFLIPTADFEKSGQYPAGTVFVEGLAYLNDTFYLYYGCADSRVGVVTTNWNPNK